jgi:ribonucleoside-diphosphate reductase alpha chain
MLSKEYGPELPLARETHYTKYREPGESFYDAMVRNAGAMADNDGHFRELKDIFLEQRFLKGGRVQAAMGAIKSVTPYNCFVSQTIHDSMSGIMSTVAQAAETMRLGGGIGYDFSTIRPKGDTIVSLSSQASGPVSFMSIFDATCKTIAAAGQRRGAQMAVLRVDHPDIEEFITCKHDNTSLTAFNISVGITREFMDALAVDDWFDLMFEGKRYKKVKAKALWDKIMRSTWDWAEPGVLYIDTINDNNAASYCEYIAATNPCGEQPLPPMGACLLGSFNLTKYLLVDGPSNQGFDYDLLAQDVFSVVRGMDNVIDRAIYPLMGQETSAKNMRRMGLGVTGLANAGEALSWAYGSPEFLEFQENVMRTIANAAYSASADLAIEKGPFPMWDPGLYGSTCDEHSVWSNLDETIREKVRLQGLRNSHLLSIAPTGTISICADNVSSGIEPTFSHQFERVIQTVNGPKTELVADWLYRTLGIKGKTADECTVEDHLGVMLMATKWVDSAVSKTCNVGDDVTWEDFKEVYVTAYNGGAKGCTTFRKDGMRMGILTSVDTVDDAAEACGWDDRGNRTCE